MKILTMMLETNEEADVLQAKVAESSGIFDVAAIRFEECLMQVFPKEGEEQICWDNLSTLLAGHIISWYNDRFVMKVLNSDSCSLSKPDKEEVRKRCADLLIPGKGHVGAIYRLICKAIIMNRLSTYFVESSEETISLRGLINFRLRDYISRVEEAVRGITESFLKEKEYHRVVSMFKEAFLCEELCTSSLYDVVYVHQNKDGNYDISDESGKEISVPEASKLSTENPEITNEDLLMASLLSIHPNKVILRNTPSDALFIKFLQDVFEDKVVFEEKVEHTKGGRHK